MLLAKVLLVVFAIITARLEDLRDNKLLLFAGMVVTTPLFWREIFSIHYLFWWIALLFLWWIVWTRKTKLVRILAKIIILAITLFLILESNGLINDRLEIDKERSFIIDNKFENTIFRFQQRATYMDYRYRFKVWGSWILLINSIGRTLRYSGGDVWVGILGIGFLFLFIRGVLSRIKWWEILVCLSGIAAVALSRNPNTLTFWWLWPPILRVSAEGMNKISPGVIIGLLVVNAIYLLTP